MPQKGHFLLSTQILPSIWHVSYNILIINIVILLSSKDI